MSFVDTVKKAVKDFFAEPDPGGPPPWSTRLKKAQYKSPSGRVIPFQYMDLEESVEKKTVAFETAIGDGTYVQDNGRTGGRFPFLCILSGGNYDERAEAFMSAMLERGEGILTHPLHGNINVVPFGEIVRGDQLSSAAGQALFGVSFFETTGIKIGGAGGLKQLFDNYNDTASVDFGDNLNTSDAADKANFITKAKAAVKKTKSVMRKISDGQTKTQKSIDSMGDSLYNGIDLIVGSPVMLARQTQIMIGEPARIAGNARAKLSGYGNLIADIFGQTFGGNDHEKTADKNDLHLSKLYAGAMIASSALTNEKPDYCTRKDYVTAAFDMRTLMDDFQAWQDASYLAVAESLVDVSATDTGDGADLLNELVSNAVAGLLQLSFDAKTEMYMETTSARTPLDLCYELYGTTSQLDFFCSTNDLSGDEIFLIEKGRSIVWYV